jgi:aminoglycoside 3-N-acetyltransferase
MHAPTNVTTETAHLQVTGEQLVSDLHTLGVEPGQIVLVHASLKSLGWVVGGAPAVVRALHTAVGPDGHVVVPTGTEANSQTSRVHRARIGTMTTEEVEAFQRDMPAFDRDNTPSGMGAISEALRTTKGAVRSAHPQSSFAAIGPRADYLMTGHPLDCHLGPESPLGKLFAADAQVLMIDVGFWAFTGFHLAEYTYTPDPPRQKYACVLPAADGDRYWEYYEDVVLDDQKFEVIGEALEESLGVDSDEVMTIKRGKVGRAQCRLVPLRPAVEFAMEWMVKHRVYPR